MNETYHKSGSSIRVEQTASGVTILRLREEGRATQQDDRFEATSLDSSTREIRDAGELLEVFERVRRHESAGIRIERLTLTAGGARHELETATESRSWTDRHARLHLSLLRDSGHHRLVIDLASSELSTLPTHLLDEPVVAFRSLREGPPRSTECSIRLDAMVSAALWSSMVLDERAGEELAEGGIPSGFRLEQREPATLTRDGRGARISKFPLLDPATGGLVSRSAWPNVFRPTYRYPPQPMPFHLTASRPGQVPESALRALALLSPFERAGRRFRVELLCREPLRGDCFAAEIDLPIPDWPKRVVGISEERIWFPFGAGTFGAATDLDRIIVSPA